MTKFGLDYETLKKRYPKLIYCSISGFGQTGPDSQRAAYAPIAHAASGYDVSHMRAQLDDNPRPQASGIMIADMLTGAYAYGAIQTALLGQLKSGAGDFIDVTMLESSMMLIPSQQQSAQSGPSQNRRVPADRHKRWLPDDLYCVRQKPPRSVRSDKPTRHPGRRTLHQR